MSCRRRALDAIRFALACALLICTVVKEGPFACLGAAPQLEVIALSR
jgi:hypothetical protein